MNLSTLSLRLIPVWAALSILIALAGCTPSQDKSTTDSVSATKEYDPTADPLRFPGEVHLRNIRQLTFGGNNAEAYWRFDDQQLIFQSDWKEINSQGCDQIYIMNADGSPLEDGKRYRLVSTGRGRTTCSYFLPDGRILYASTHASAPECPPPAMANQGRYVWPLYDTYDVYTANPDGSGVRLLIGGEGYDAEATVSPDGRYIVFTSTRSGDIELWRYQLEIGALLQLTHELGYDGGAFFSPDSQRIVWRASRPTGKAAEEYRALLADGLVEPGELDIFVADVDGTKLVFASNRNVTRTPTRDINIFIADWVKTPD